MKDGGKFRPARLGYDSRLNEARRNPFVYVGDPSIMMNKKQKSSISPNGVGGSGVGEGISDGGRYS
jgi:hypothetical protein